MRDIRRVAEKHKSVVGKWVKFALRWGIAVAGIYWVVTNISMYDRVLVRGADGWPVSMKLAKQAGEQDPFYDVVDAGSTRAIARTELMARADREKVSVREAGGEKKYAVLGLLVREDSNRSRWPIVVAPPRNLWQRYWNVHNGAARVIEPEDVVGPYAVSVPYPIVDRGLLPMVRAADPWLFWGAIVIFPVTFIITSLRWNELLKLVGIRMGAGKAFVVNMVGAFYNTFMPGSTGGDVLKAYYAAKLAPKQRTRAVVSVIVDRAVGLLALIILGGAMAGALAIATRTQSPAGANELIAKKCAQVAVGAAVIVVMTVLGLVVLFVPVLRRASGMELALRLLPMQERVKRAIEAMELYRQNLWWVIVMLVVTFPVHIVVILSATLAGEAFKLPLRPWYYWVVVPVVVLAGSIPISPQGAGVMEFFAVLLTRAQGATVSQAFALTMSIRLVQIFWNLTGGIFVLRGGYHAPSEVEERQVLEAEAVKEPSPQPSG